jgi:glycyl-tRNA synthetase (class II)
LNDNKVTVRERDTTKQERKKIQDIASYIKEKISS